MISINLQAMLKNREVPAYVKDAIRCIMDRGGCTVGSYLKKVSTSDIRAALTSCDHLFDILSSPEKASAGFKTDGRTEGIITLMDVLSTGEALEISSSTSTLKDRFNALKILLGVEQLSRQKPDLEVLYQNLTLDVDRSSEVPIAKCKGRELKYPLFLGGLKTRIGKAFVDALEEIVDKEEPPTSEPTVEKQKTPRFNLSSLLPKQKE